MSLSGECFCGSIQYQIDGKVDDARSCHCSRCRKAFSSQASSYGVVNHEEFNWISGESLLSSYINQQGFGIQFCKTCGSTLVGVFDGKVHGITLGCLNDDPELTEIRHIYVGSKAAWETLPDSATQYEAAMPNE